MPAPTHTATLTPERVGAILQVLRARVPDVLGICAFGSRLQGHAGPDSDLDLAVLADIAKTGVVHDR